MRDFVGKKVTYVLAVGALCGAFCLGASQVRASETDTLLEIMQQKGMLTKEEAEQVKKDAQKASAEQEKKLEEKVAKSQPDWVKNLKFKGDVRVRYQSENIRDDDKGQTDLGRFRLRFGAETTPVDCFSLGFGLASGSSNDPRSTNQTMGNLFAKKQIWIDYAYGQYKPAPWLSFTAGRFANPIWQPFEFLWDNDIRAEGIAGTVKAKAGENLGFFFNTGYLVLNADDGSTGTSYVAFFQPGVDWRITDIVNLKLAASYYMFNDLQDINFDDPDADEWTRKFKRNTLIGSSGDKTLKYKYSAPTFEAELGFNKLFGDVIPYVGIFGQYTHNPDPSDENSGYIAGIKFGHDKIGKLWDWQLAYAYRRLEVDAWPDFLPYSDFYSGYTGAKGHQAQLSLGLAKNTWLVLNYLRADPVAKTKGTNPKGWPWGTQNLLQVDLNWKF